MKKKLIDSCRVRPYTSGAAIDRQNFGSAVLGLKVAAATGKLCPRPWCCADMNVYYKTSGDAQWEEFKKRISDGKEEDEDMTLDTFKELMKEYRAELQDNDCGTWSKEAREWAISNGLINGTGTEVNGEPNYAWADQLTREQAAALFYRFAKLMGKA